MLLVRRPWAAAERKVVSRGCWGRAMIAIEPVICGLVFFGLTVGLFLEHSDVAWVFGPIFALATFAFAVYAVAVMVSPLRALMQTFSPIYIVDGYVRYRCPDLNSDPQSNGYIAVLNEHRRQLCEWPLFGKRAVVESTFPAMVEFTHFGGIHRIDGRPTGVLPTELPPLGIGIAASERR
ncbi:MAG: hypothetical protein ACREM6_02790 [Vulcanimicrobiaceae bacterium]